MSTTQEKLPLAQLAAAGSEQIAAQEPPEPAAPARKPKAQKLTNFDHRAKHFFTVPGGPEQRLTGTVVSEHADGKNAIVSVHWPIANLTVLSSKILEGSTVPLEVRIDIAPGYTVNAKYRAAHAVKEGKEPMCTLHLRWPTASIIQAPEPTRKGKRKAESGDSDPESKALKEGLKVPKDPLCCLLMTTDDFLEPEPSLPEIRALMLRTKGSLAHLLPAETPPGTRVPVLIDTLMADYLIEALKRNEKEASDAMQGFSLHTCPFCPKTAIDLEEVKNFLKRIICPKSESVCLVLGYDNASVVNETYPNMAFGANKRALECAARAKPPARAQSPATSDSDSVIDLVSESDDE
jgi:hypothetical protein